MPKQLFDIEKSHATLGGLLASHHAALCDLFINPSTLDNIVTFTDAFSADLSSFWGFEIPLSESSEADFLFCVHKPEELAKWGLQANCYLDNSPFYNGLNSFSSDWVEQLKPHISNVWFEYDHAQMEIGNYVPNFFVGPAKGLHPLHLIATLQPLLKEMGGCANAESYRFLLKVIRQLPNGGWLSQIGQMMARGDNHLRVFIQDLPKGSIPELLKNLDYEGNLNTGLLSWLEFANKYCKKVELDLDITTKLGKQLGIELYFEEMESALRFLEKLQEHGLCTKEKYDRLYNHLIKLRVDKTASIHRFLSHFKISFDGASTFKAKAYIGFITKDQMPFAFGTKPLKITKP